ncbi:DUF2909 domain-containing protein [Jeongeupia chitinilytica]|uniref:DUF2909 domain-containing protein n=1 Tax=Jeongeupia chitinilytica TaxID=1041641 RepID=A0ABQ3H3Q8_9NEIS|nr:DUF2909 domain-containing protein [Jeongeupia chitinilytica]GHD68099.1 hypothetical protein GCM10007350_32780 [Jeongeupia chitinilytica]
MKVVAIVLLLVILLVLGRAMLQLVRGPAGSPKLVRSLTWRVALSVGLFVLLLIGYHFGWWRPHGA